MRSRGVTLGLATLIVIVLVTTGCGAHKKKVVAADEGPRVEEMTKWESAGETMPPEKTPEKPAETKPAETKPATTKGDKAPKGATKPAKPAPATKPTPAPKKGAPPPKTASAPPKKGGGAAVSDDQLLKPVETLDSLTAEGAAPAKVDPKPAAAPPAPVPAPAPPPPKPEPAKVVVAPPPPPPAPIPAPPPPRSEPLPPPPPPPRTEPPPSSVTASGGYSYGSSYGATTPSAPAPRSEPAPPPPPPPSAQDYYARPTRGGGARAEGGYRDPRVTREPDADYGRGGRDLRANIGGRPVVFKSGVILGNRRQGYAFQVFESSSGASMRDTEIDAVIEVDLEHRRDLERNRAIPLKLIYVQITDDSPKATKGVRALECRGRGEIVFENVPVLPKRLPQDQTDVGDAPANIALQATCTRDSSEFGTFIVEGRVLFRLIVLPADM